jgi:hypothetical protein
MRLGFSKLEILLISRLNLIGQIRSTKSFLMRTKEIQLPKCPIMRHQLLFAAIKPESFIANQNKIKF